MSKLKRTVSCLKFLALVLFLGTICPFRAAGAKEEVRVVSISPSTNKPLRVGDTVDFEIKVEYQVSEAKLRRIWVAIFSASETLASWTQVVGSGQGNMTLSQAVRIPETSAISVRTGMADLPERGREQKSVPLLSRDSRDYGVVDAAGKRTKSAASVEDAVKIVSSVPAPGASLRVGETVRFDIQANYELRSAETGRVVWGWATGGDVQGVLASESIRKGKGTLVFNRSVQIRRGTGSDPFIFALLMPEGSVRGTRNDRKFFHLDQAQESQATATPQIAVDVTGELEDHVSIVSISPPPGTVLHGGETIDFKVQVNYEIASLDAVDVSVRFGTSPAYALDTRVLRKGQGTFTVNRRLLIPKDSGGDFPVNVRFSAPANATDVQTYPISAP